MAVGQCAQCRVYACSSRLLPSSPPPATVLLHHALLLVSGCPWKTSSSWKTPSHLPGSFGRGPTLLCEAAGAHSRTQHLRRQTCHVLLGQLLDRMSCSHELGIVLLPQPPLPLLSPLPPAPCASLLWVPHVQSVLISVPRAEL